MNKIFKKMQVYFLQIIDLKILATVITFLMGYCCISNS